MVLKETKRALRNLRSKYSDILASAKRDLKPSINAEPGDENYSGIQKEDKLFIYNAISTLYEYVIDIHGAIGFDIKNEFITENRALAALKETNGLIKLNLDKLSEIKKKYDGKRVDHWPIESCNSHHQEIYDVLSEIMNSTEVKTFLSGNDNEDGLKSKSKNARLSKTIAFHWIGKIGIEKLQETLENNGIIGKGVDPKKFETAFSGEELDGALKIPWVSVTQKKEPNKLNLFFLLDTLTKNKLIEKTDLPRKGDYGTDLFNKIRKIFVDINGNEIENLGESFKTFNHFMNIEALKEKIRDAAAREVKNSEDLLFDSDEDSNKHKVMIYEKLRDALCKEHNISRHAYEKALNTIEEKRKKFEAILKGLR